MLPPTIWKWIAVAAVGYILLTPWPFRSRQQRAVTQQQRKRRRVQDGKAEHEHHGVKCNNCSEAIVGTRWLCINCTDFDLCSNCVDSTNIEHSKTHVYLKIEIPVPAFLLFRRFQIPPIYPGGQVEEAIISPDGTQLQTLTAETHYSLPELRTLAERYWALATTRQGIRFSPSPLTRFLSKATFNACLGPLGTDGNLLCELVFRLFDRNRDGFVDFSEFAAGMSVLSRGSKRERLESLLAVLDREDGSFITLVDISALFRAYYQVSMKIVRSQLKVVEDTILERFDDESADPVSSLFSVMESEELHLTDQGVDTEASIDDALMQQGYLLAVERIAQDVFTKCPGSQSGRVSVSAFLDLVDSTEALPDFAETIGTVF